jgi:glycosyltransferase involved in cell wall biosynthesis
MKILHLNANSAGGAFTAANRLSASLVRMGVDSRHVVFSGISGDGYELWANNPVRRSRAFYNHASEKLDFLRYEKDATVRFAFSHGLNGVDVTDWKAFADSDIIHLHWINKGFISLKGLSDILQSGKPVVWTCHDMWPFTGGCYHNRGCYNFKTGCGNCQYLKKPLADDLSARVFRRKQQIFSSEKLHFVTPSAWLAGQAALSPVANGKQVEVIYNGIDTALFQPADSGLARKHLGIPGDAKVIAFAAATLTNPKKGFAEFQALVNLLHTSGVQKLHVLLIGENKNNIPLDFPVPHTFTGYLTKESDMVKCYQAATLYVTTSHEENLPTTIMESMACGTPVAAFSVGGIPEMVEDGKNGCLADLFDVHLLADKIASYLNSEEAEKTQKRDQARLSAAEKYEQNIVAAQYKRIYEKILK